MSVQADAPPSPEAMVTTIDKSARVAVNAARTIAVPAMRAALPSRSGRVRRGTTGRVAQTPTGYRLDIAPSSRVRYPNGVSAKQVARFIEKGTGIFGPRKRVIRPRRARAFHLPGGWRSSTVRGQRGQHYFARMQEALTGTVYRALDDGARAAARAIERGIGGAR